MARAPNPYRADAGQYSGIGEGISNLANVFLNSQPDPVKTAQAQAQAWQARESREGVQDTVDARRGRQDIGRIFTQGYDPNADMGQVMGQGIGSGAFDGGGLGELLLTANANLGGSDDQVFRSLLGTGTMPGLDKGMSRDDREGIRSTEFGNTQALQGQQDAAAMQRLQARLASERELETMGGGAGGTGDLGNMDWLGVTRQGNVRGDMVTEALNILGEMGLPYDADAEQYETSLLEQAAPGLFYEALDEAWAEMQRDSVGGVPQRAPTSYVDDALRSRIGGIDYQEGRDYLRPWKDDVPEGISVRPPQGQRGNVGVTPIAPPSQGPLPGDVEDGYEFIGGNPADPNSWRPVQ